MDNQNFKNQYVLERMVVWLINPLELNLSQFNLSEKIDTWEKFSVSHLEKGNCANSPPGKIYLEIEIPGKKTIIMGPTGFLHPYPCMDKKWNSPI